MDTKNIHCMLEKMAEYGKCMIEEGVGCGNVNLCDAGQIVDMVKDLACAEKDALIAKEMRKAEEDDEAEEKYIRKMLKEENKDEYKRMREEYGEDEGERRFYDNYRWSNGRFAPKGRGNYEPRRSGRRRGYEEMPYMHMYPEMYVGISPEEMRDMDLDMNRMYYTPAGGSYGAKSGGSSRGGSSSNMSDGSSSGSVRGYEEGYSDGQTRGYSEGYERGSRDGRSSQARDRREGRSGQSRRRYFESKEENKGNSAEEKQKKMKELESYMKDIAEDLTEAIGDASNEERTLIKAKLQTLMQKM